MFLMSQNKTKIISKMQKRVNEVKLKEMEHLNMGESIEDQPYIWIYP